MRQCASSGSAQQSAPRVVGRWGRRNDALARSS